MTVPGTAISVFVGGWAVILDDWLTLQWTAHGVTTSTTAPADVIRVLYMRAILDAEGDLWAVAQTGAKFNGANRLLIYSPRDGWTVTPYACVAQSGVLIGMADEDIHIWTQDTPYHALHLTFEPDGTLAGVLGVEAPPPLNVAGTSQGFLQLQGLTPIWTDTRPAVTVGGITFRYPQIQGDVTVGQYGASDYCGGVDTGVPFTAVADFTLRPALAVEPSGLIRIGTPMNNGVVAYVEGPPFLPFTDLEPPAVVPDLPAFDHSVWLGVIDGSSEAFGYYPSGEYPYALPGNCEGLVRAADVSRRRYPTRPAVARWREAMDLVDEDLLALWGDTSAPETLETTRAVAASRRRDAWVYHDGTPWQGPAWSRPLVQAYRHVGETLDQTVQRITEAIESAPNPAGLVGMLYTQGKADGTATWTVQQILDLQPWLVELVNRYHLETLLLFAWAGGTPPTVRGGGLAHPAFREVAERMAMTAGSPPRPWTEPPLPNPSPEPELPMNIGYAQKPEGPFTRAALVAGSGAGTVAIVKLDGRPLSMQPDGSVQDRDPGAIGSWESGRRNGSIVAYSDAAYHENRVYLLYIVETV